MDRYYFYNTDGVDEFHGLKGANSRIHILRNEGFAASGGDPKFGEQLGMLDVGDTLLMYENGTGVIGLGTVTDLWDGKTYRRAKYYPSQGPGNAEYRIPVVWDPKVCDFLREHPISLEEIRSRFDSPKFRVRGRHSAVLQIAKHHDSAVLMVDEIRKRCTSTKPADIARDLSNSAIKNRNAPTTARREIEARLGQGKFREDVLELWGGKCAVTGATTVDAIRASHIKPWCESNDEERLDRHNGIPLIATLDALFDKGLISFDENGKMLVQDLLTKNERLILGVLHEKQIELPSRKTAKFLSWHRKRFGFET